MTVYDPAWDMPEPNWRPVGSFQQAAPSPGVDPTSEPVVCIPVNAAWVKVLIGCLDQLCIPATWAASSDADLNGILQWVALLKQQVANAEACMQLRWSDADCAVEQSTDGGATWSKISGWPVGPPACFVGATGATGATGGAGATGATGEAGPASIWRMSGCALQYSNDGGSTWATAAGWDISTLQQCLIPAPGNPQGASTVQQACNIAGYISDLVIKGAMTQITNELAGAGLLVNAVTAVVDLIPGVGEIAGLFVTGAALLFNAISLAGTSAYTTAEGDATLWARITCAIYLAIVADGMVTPANFASLVAGVGGVSYGTPAVIGSIVAYLNALGASGLMQAQVTGAAYVADCSNCAEWCFTWNFAAGAGPWTIQAGDGAYVAGVGFTAQSTASGWNHSDVTIGYPWTGGRKVETVEVGYFSSSGDAHSNSYVNWYTAGPVGHQVGYGPTGDSTNRAIVVNEPGGADAAIQINVRLSQDNLLANNVIRYVTFRGHGANPFGTNNC